MLNVQTIWIAFMGLFRKSAGTPTKIAKRAPIKEWCCYSIAPLAIFDQYRLEADGCVLLGGVRFRPGDLIDLHFANHHASRPALPDAYLLVERPDGIRSYFQFQNGVWYRWTAMYRANAWRYGWHDIVRSWGPACPLIAACFLVIAITLAATLVAFIVDPKRALIGIGLSILAAIALIAGGTNDNHHHKP